MDGVLKDRVAIVTGGGRGIGKAIACLMANEGARVIVNDLGGEVDGTGSSKAIADEVVHEIVSKGGTAVANYDSVATMEGGERIIKTALDNFGRLDILVNNAGVLRTNLLVDMSEEDWDKVITVNLKGHFACTKPAVRYMIEQRYGRIINISSGAALGTMITIAGGSNYAAAKAGILGFTRALARELGKYGITVNAIMPAAWTRMVWSEGPARIPSKREQFSNPEEIAPIVVYLSSEEAANINGYTFGARAKGIIELMCDPTPIRSICKEGVWSVDELRKTIPKLLV